jgi:uncharacterized membrane protein affecting hemolysin expression
MGTLVFFLLLVIVLTAVYLLLLLQVVSNYQKRQLKQNEQLQRFAHALVKLNDDLIKANKDIIDLKNKLKNK